MALLLQLLETAMTCSSVMDDHGGMLRSMFEIVAPKTGTCQIRADWSSNDGIIFLEDGDHGGVMVMVL